MGIYNSTLEEIVTAGATLFDFEYDIVATFKAPFESLFYKHFKRREIGFDTSEYFLERLEDKMLTVFPYYNYLLQSKSREYQVLSNYSLTDTTTRTNTHSETLTDATTVTTENDLTNNGTENETIGKTIDNLTATTTANDTTFARDQTVTNEQLTDAVHHSITSELPDNVVSLTDFTGNVYAKEGTTDIQKDGKHSLNDTNAETTNIDIVETVDGLIKDDSTRANTSQTTINNDTTAVTAGTKTGNATDTETTTHTTAGNIGVQTDMDAMLTDFKLQNVLQGIYSAFFNECEDLFMLIF
jgi:hypothetical protein